MRVILIISMILVSNTDSSAWAKPKKQPKAPAAKPTPGYFVAKPTGENLFEVFIDVFDTEDLQDRLTRPMPIFRATANEPIVIAAPGDTDQASARPWTILDAEKESNVQPLYVKTNTLKKLTKPPRMVLDLDEEHPITTIFSRPGASWKNCEDPKTKHQCVAWPNKNAEIYVIGSKFIYYTDPVSGEQSWQLFQKVRYKYTPPNSVTPKSGEGWIHSDFLRAQSAKEPTRDELAASKTRNVTGTAPDCPATSPSAATMAAIETISNKTTEILDELKNEEKRKETEKLIAQLKPVLGACYLDPKTSELPKLSQNKPVFEQTISAQWEQNDLRPKNDTLKARLSKNDVIAIDILARTLYGEMGKCFEHGLQYPKAVARVILNRAEQIERGTVLGARFDNTPKNELKNPIAQAILADAQFSAWNISDPPGSGKPNRVLKQVLCPPSAKNQTFWTKELPTTVELKLWSDAVAIATDAVINRESFKNETQHVSQFFYTSGKGRFLNGYRKVPTSIGNKALWRDKCIELWDLPTDEQALAQKPQPNGKSF